MNYSQEFTDIICAQNRAKVEFLLHITQIDTPVFHLSGIAAAGCIHCQCLTDNLRWNGLFLLLAAGMIGSFLLYIVLGRHIDGLLGLRTGIKGFINGTFPSFYLLSAGLPGIINPRIKTYPDNVEFLCHFYILSGTSIPSRPMPSLMILPTFWARTRRNILRSRLGSFMMLKSW